MPDTFVVLESFREPRSTTNPYVVQLARSLRALTGVSVLTFRWTTALFGRYDVVHLHWPEILTTGTTPTRAVVNQVRFTLLIARWWLTRTPVVRTVHNLRPHEGASGPARWLLQAVDRLTTVRIHLNEHTPAGPVPHVVIPHGHYVDWYAPHPVGDALAERVVTIGIVRAYKQVPHLIEVFRSSAPADGTLHVVGAVPDPALADLVEAAAADDPRVELDLRHVDDARFVAEVTAAELVALPYDGLHNSGLVLAALSLGRPVLVPDTTTTRALSAEVGHGWVRMFPAPLDAATLRDAMSVRIPDRLPDLSARGWAGAAVAHRAAFDLAVARRRAGRLSRP